MQPTRGSVEEFQTTPGALDDESSRQVGARSAGLAGELSAEWIAAVRNAQVPAEYAALDAELS